MSSRLNPYIAFAGTAREALEFYKSVFGGTLRLSTFGEFGAPEPALADKIMHGQLETDAGYTIMGADSATDDATTTSTITISLSGDDNDLLRGYWEKLAATGTVVMPLEKQMWGDEFGQLTDAYGIAWMVNIGQAA